MKKEKFPLVSRPSSATIVENSFQDAITMCKKSESRITSFRCSTELSVKLCALTLVVLLSLSMSSAFAERLCWDAIVFGFKGHVKNCTVTRSPDEVTVYEFHEVGCLIRMVSDTEYTIDLEKSKYFNGIPMKHVFNYNELTYMFIAVPTPKTYTVEYFYNSNGKLSRKKFDNGNGDTTFTYDNDGNLSTCEYELPWGHVKESYMNCKYDKYGNCIKRTINKQTTDVDEGTTESETLTETFEFEYY